MNTRFELLLDEQGRVAFCLVGTNGEVMLQGLPCSGKITAQREIMHTRESLQAAEFLVPHEKDGEHFVVVKGEGGDVLAKSRRVRSAAELTTLVEAIRNEGVHANIIDQTRRQAVP